MYANHVSVARSGKECFVKFDCVGPNFEEKGEQIPAKVIQSEMIMMDEELLKQLNGLIINILGDIKEG